MLPAAAGSDASSHWHCTADDNIDHGDCVNYDSDYACAVYDDLACKHNDRHRDDKHATDNTGTFANLSARCLLST